MSLSSGGMMSMLAGSGRVDVENVLEVSSAEVGEKIMEGLRGLDQVAYVRFASVYRSFKDIHEFMDELSDLLGDGGRSS